MASQVPQQSSRSGEMLKEKDEYCQARSRKDFDHDEHFSQEYWESRNEHRARPNEFSYQNLEQPGFTTFLPRLSYDPPRPMCRRFIPPQFDSSCIYYGQQEPRFHDPNFGFREKQLRHHSDGHEFRPREHDCPEKIQNVMLQVRDPTESQLSMTDLRNSGQKFAQEDSEFDQDSNCPNVENPQHFRPDDRTHCHGSIYPTFGYSGFANQVSFYDPGSLDRFNQESLRSQSTNTLLSCPCHLQNERRIVHNSMCIDHTIYGDAYYCDTRYFDRNGPHVCCHDFGYLKHLRDYDVHDLIPQNYESEEPENPRSKWQMAKTNSQQAGNFALREQCSQTCSNQKLVGLPEGEDEGANHTAKRRNEFQDIKRHSPTNSSANFDNRPTRSRPKRCEVDKTEKSTTSKDIDEKEIANSKDNDSARNSAVKPRTSYFLSLNRPTHARSSFHVNETKMASVFSKKTQQQRNSPTKTTAAMTSPTESRDNASVQDGFRDDSSLRSSTWCTADAGFVRGGTRSSLRLPSDRRPVLSGISSRVGKAGGDDAATSKTASVDHRDLAGKGVSSKHGEADCTRASPNTARNEVFFTRLEARQSKPAFTRDDSTMTKTKKQGTVSTGSIDIYCSFRRPRKTNKSANGSPYSAQSSCSLLRCPSTNSSSSSSATSPTVKPGYSARHFQGTEGKGDGGGRGSLRRSSSFQEKDKELTESEGGGEISLDSKEDFTSLERNFNSAISVIASGRVTTKTAKSKYEKSTTVPSSGFHHLPTKANSCPGETVRNGEEDAGTATSNTLSSMTDVFLTLSSSSASLRQDGLSYLQYLLRSGTALSKKDIRRLTEVFTRMFHDPQTKVFSLFVEVLVEFIEEHNEDIEEWLPVCLDRLLTRLGSDLLGSVHNKVLRALETIRNTFRLEPQLTALAKFLSQSQNTSNVKVKSSVLDHLQFFIETMNPSDLRPDNESFVTVLSVVIKWAMESKVSACKKAAKRLIISAFNLSPPLFSAILNHQSKAEQNFVRNLLRNYLRSASSGADEDGETKSESSSSLKDTFVARASRIEFKEETSSLVSTPEAVSGNFRKFTPDGSHVNTRSPETPWYKAVPTAAATTSSAFHRERRSLRSGKFSFAVGKLEEEEETDKGSRLPRFIRAEEEVPVQMDRMSKDSGIFVASEESREELSPDVNFSPVFSPDEVKSMDDLEIGQSHVIKARTDDGGQSEANKSEGCEEDGIFVRTEDISEDIDAWQEIQLTFSSNNSSDEKRKEAMKTLLRDSPNRWTQITDRCLKSLLSSLLLLSNRTDEVSELADSCIAQLLKRRSAKTRVLLLSDVSDAKDFQIKLSALKLQCDELRNLTQQEVKQVLPQTVPGLIKAYEDDDSGVRKAGLLCLVQLYRVIGEELLLHIKSLNNSKKNLLMMFFTGTQSACQMSQRTN